MRYFLRKKKKRTARKRKLNKKKEDGWPAEETSKQLLHRLLSEEPLRGCKLLVIATKQDLPKALSIEEVRERMGLDLIRGREWKIVGCCSTALEDCRDIKEKHLRWMCEPVKM